MLEIVVSASEKYTLEKTNLFDKKNIIDVSLLLCIGEIKGIKTSDIRSVCGYNIDVKGKLDELKQKVLKTNKIRIWYSSLDNEDVCTLYFVINYLSDIKDLNIYVCDASSQKYFSLGGYPISEVNSLLDKTRKLTQQEIELYKNCWNRLEEENADLRINYDNKLESYSFEYLHHDIIELLEKYDSISYFEFVGECLKLKLCGFYTDIVFTTAIDDLIDIGRINVCEIKQEKNFKGEIVNKKYIKVSD